MSATSKNKKSQQPTLVTTGRGAAVAVTFGITLLTLGIAWLISEMNVGDSAVLSELVRTLEGLAGPFCIGIPVLTCWAGAKLLVSARHRVSVRDIMLVCCLYLLLLAGFTLIAKVSVNGSAISFMDYVGRRNYEHSAISYDSFSTYLRQAFHLRRSGAGGMLGMAIAYPVWRVAGSVLGIILVAALFIVFLFMLLRVNPAKLMNRISEKDAHRTKKAAPASPDSERRVTVQAANPSPAPERGEYAPPPVYDEYGTPAVSARPVQNGFIPVSPNLYEEHFVTEKPPIPELEAQTDCPEPDAKPQVPEYRESGVKEQEPAYREPDIRPRAPIYREPAGREQLLARPSSASVGERSSAPDRPIADKPLSASPARDSYAAEAGKQFVKPVSVPCYDLEDGDLPWETEEKHPAPQTTARLKEPPKSVPSAAIPEKKPQPDKPAPAPGSWSAMVKKKQDELKDDSFDLPEHTTAKGEPKPVYTDPVMPISRERIAIASRSTEKKEDEKLDGTLAPKPQQGRMGLSVPYQAPPLRLLLDPKPVPVDDAEQEDARRAAVIESTLGSFGVESQVKQIMHGPSITRFAIQIAPGVKVSRVTNTADNLALDLMTKHVRVEAPIQGTSFIGIEVPNAVVNPVTLKEVLNSPEMNSKPLPLLVALGKDIAGSPVLCDLSKMPHLLIAGATGSGKSVCINSIVCSLLYRTSPDQVRLIMIDPKQVELNVYNSIPHLLVPVISDPKKAAGALAWVVQEMLERYGKFSSQGVRNLAGYNKVNQGTDKVLPNIVVIIDEMADLMEVCRKDVEESIRRLAALARAAGIYMVLATQRPSVDVITGVIKNNIPSRIAFAVSSGTDSRTIIDINGAEKLMGKGDMLYKPAGSSPVRVQGCLVTDDEVNDIADYISRRYETDYDPDIIEHLENAEKEKPEADEIGGEEDYGVDNNEKSVDELLAEAIEMAVEDGQTSTSMLQRRLRIGYARAGRLVDEMEKRGIVSHSEGSKPRKTLMTREQYYENLSDLNDQ